MTRAAVDFETPNSSELPQRQIATPIGGDQQHPVLQQQTPRPASVDHICSIAPQRGQQPAEAARAQPCERAMQDGFDAVITLATS